MFRYYERAIREWLAQKRPAPAIELIFLIVDQHNPAIERVLESLEMLLVSASAADVRAGVGWGGVRIGKLIKYLQADPTVESARLMAIEWSFLSLLLRAGESPKTLFAALANQPAFFVELIGNIYRSTDERDGPARELTQQEQNRADLARQLLEKWQIIPGTQSDGSIAEAILRDWAEGVRGQAGAQKLEDVVDHSMGELFAHAPADGDGAWPCLPVRRIIDDWKSEELESGMSCERFNEYQPGSVTKPIPEKTWDELVQKHRKDATTLAGRWPRTAAFLRELAASYEGTSRRNKRDSLHDD
jgi:hypothetical protein